jgi:phytoene dehydrogenase-like protein
MTRPILVIGAGHNGLACAATLARAGRKVLVLEAGAGVGGMSVTREFAPGFRVSAIAHLAQGLDAALVRELALERHGLEYARRSLSTVALARSGPALVLDGAQVLAGELSPQDRAALSNFDARMNRFAALLAKQYARVPPRLSWDSWRGALPAALFALDVRRLGREDMQELLRIVTMPIHDVLEESFASEALKGALALEGLLGTRLGPRSGGTVLSFLHRRSGTPRHALVKGGVGALAEALARAARAAGAEIRLGARVGAITMREGRVAGVALTTGEEIAADAVVSSADPKTTLLGLLGARHLETDAARRVQHLRASGTAAKLHLALAGRPAFAGVAPEHLGERLLICPDLSYADRAFDPAKYRAASEEPVFEITLPSVHDPALAPAGQHVLSAIVQYAPRDLEGGWTAARSAFEARLVAVLERYAPGIKALVRASELITPEDIERDYLASGGHWHHGELALDQFLMLRPIAGAGQYRMPVDGLYLCGAGAHPGGGVMGSAGRNAARAILGEAGRP